MLASSLAVLPKMTALSPECVVRSPCDSVRMSSMPQWPAGLTEDGHFICRRHRKQPRLQYLDRSQKKRQAVVDFLYIPCFGFSLAGSIVGILSLSQDNGPLRSLNIQRISTASEFLLMRSHGTGYRLRSSSFTNLAQSPIKRCSSFCMVLFRINLQCQVDMGL